MSNQDETEQVTNNPLPTDSEAVGSVHSEAAPKVKEKDPKKVAAGKKLAEYNRTAKEKISLRMKNTSFTLKREMKDGFHIIP